MTAEQRRILQAALEVVTAMSDKLHDDYDLNDALERAVESLTDVLECPE